MEVNLEYRVRRGFLVQIAAWTRSWRLVRFAARFVRIEARAKGLQTWVTLDVRPAIEPETGAISWVSIRGAQ